MQLKKVLVIIAVAAISGCSLFPTTHQPLELTVRGSTFTIAWDPPLFDSRGIDEGFLSFNLYYRQYTAGSSPLFGGNWDQLSSVPYSENPEFTVTSELLDYGKYEFAVSAVRANGSETGKHASTESSADPPTGWYVFWIGSE